MTADKNELKRGEASGASERWKKRLQDAFGPAEILVTDDSHRHAGHLPPGAPGGGTHASVRVVSEAFRGLSLSERHRRIYAALGIGGSDPDLHALQVRALTPEEAGRTPTPKPHGQ